LSLLVVSTALGGCNRIIVLMASGPDITTTVRPSLADDGTVVVAEPDRLRITKPLAPEIVIDLAALGLHIQ
jgi:hypothetical protein